MLNQRLASYENIVAIGGGHGLGRVLASLSFLGERLTGIVATTDNGGSTGRIRQDQSTIAWGDLRNCLSHLATRPSLATSVFDHRFTGDNELNGHNLGNLVLHALDQLCVRPLDAVNLVRNMLKINTRIIPMSEASTHLCALTIEGNKVIGELNVDDMHEAPVALHLEPAVTATTEAIHAIEQADLIIVSPGSFLTSILPPLLIPELANKIKSSSAKVIFIDNLTSDNSAGSRFNLSAKINWIHQVLGQNVVTDVIRQTGIDDGSELNSIHIHHFDLVSSHHRGLHDKIALGDAICQVTREN
ncbi:uridine diphosphate-N-acetylglucosamine-binding protein YvcK [Shewanella gaetbuli]